MGDDCRAGPGKKVERKLAGTNGRRKCKSVEWERQKLETQLAASVDRQGMSANEDTAIFTPGM